MSTGPRPYSHRPHALVVCSCSSETIRVLESPLRRRVLVSLLERNAVELTELSSELTFDLENTGSNDDTHDQDAVAASLYHTHIPKLEAAGLVAGRRADGVYTLHLHRDVYGGPLTRQLLRSTDQEVWTAVATVYRDRRRGAVLTLLSEYGPTLTRESLASKIVATQGRESARSAGDSSETRAEVERALHHVHLPVLAKTGLVGYDTATGEVTYTGARFFDLADFVATLPPRMRVEL